MERKGRNKQGKNPWQQAQHVWLYTDLLQGLNGERLSGELLGKCIALNTVERAIRKKQAQEQNKKERTSSVGLC